MYKSRIEVLVHPSKLGGLPHAQALDSLAHARP
jgi:hypothetical protein